MLHRRDQFYKADKTSPRLESNRTLLSLSPMTATLPLHHHHKSKRYLDLTTNTKRFILVFTIFCTFCFIFRPSTNHSSTQIAYNINPHSWAPRISFQDTDSSAYPARYFTEESLRENELKTVSAVLLRVTDNDQGIVNVVQHLLKYPFIREIYIHNLIPNRPLTLEKLRINDQVTTPVEILEVEEEQLRSMARFTTCATAAQPYCYFQDDTFNNKFMDSLYTNFLRFPSLIHANSKPSHYEKELKWRFFNKDIRMHTGYADLRYGAFVDRWKVQTFLTQLGKSSLSKENIREAEHYFPIWMNQYPWLLSNPPYRSNGVKATDFDTGYLTNLDTYTYDAIRHLQRSLENDRSEAPQDYFERQEEGPSLTHRDVRSSCANDKCLLITNMESHVSPERTHFDYRNITSMEKIEKMYEKMSPQNEWAQQSYHNAIDSDPNTCWDTLKAPRKNDYFGLMLVGSLSADTLTIHTPNEIIHPEKELLISVLEEKKNEWVQCKAASTENNYSGRLQLSIKCPVKDYRLIKVTFKNDLPAPFKLCSLSLENFVV